MIGIVSGLAPAACATSQDLPAMESNPVDTAMSIGCFLAHTAAVRV